jgi:hypothetical protein
MGFPHQTTSWLIAMRARYHAAAMDTATTSYCVFDFAWQMTSGALYTLTWNTVANMAITGSCFDFGRIHLAAFKGDDVHILSDKCTDKYVNSISLADYLGHKIKISHPNISEFLANIITPHGFFPDVIRRVSRVVSRINTHPDDWDEIRRSIADCISVVNNHTISLGGEIAAYHYQERGYDITPQDIYAMMVFLIRCTYDDAKRPRLQNNYLVECLNIEQRLFFQ